MSGAPFPVKAGHHGAGFAFPLNETVSESLVRAEDADFVRADHNAIDEEMQPGAVERRVGASQSFTNQSRLGLSGQFVGCL